MTREEKVNDIKQWYEKRSGKAIIERLMPKQADMIAQYYSVPQMLNIDKIAGTYCFTFCKDGLKYDAYVGESGNVFWRLLEHIYNLVNGITDWGVSIGEILNQKIKIEWSCNLGIVEKNRRETEETRLINTLKPFLQYTDPLSDEYGNDKRQIGLRREEIRPDICVRSHLRKKRAMKLFAA